jgi:hypothetical protein
VLEEEILQRKKTFLHGKKIVPVMAGQRSPQKLYNVKKTIHTVKNIYTVKNLCL